MSTRADTLQGSLPMLVSEGPQPTRPIARLRDNFTYSRAVRCTSRGGGVAISRASPHGGSALDKGASDYYRTQPSCTCVPDYGPRSTSARTRAAAMAFDHGRRQQRAKARVGVVVSWLSRVANVFRRSTLDRAIDEEIAFHIESRIEDLMSSGMLREEAETQAYRQFGSVSRAREASRNVKLMLPLDDLLRDGRHGLRALRRAPVFTLVVILTLGFTIGANTAVFSVVNAVLIKPLSYPQSNELVSLRARRARLEFRGTLGLSLDLYFTYRDENRTFEHLGLFADGGATITGVGDPEQARVRVVSNGVLQALGVQPMLGRWFSEADHAPQAAGPVFQLGGYRDPHLRVLAAEIRRRSECHRPQHVDRFASHGNRRRNARGLPLPEHDARGRGDTADAARSQPSVSRGLRQFARHRRGSNPA